MLGLELEVVPLGCWATMHLHLHPLGRSPRILARHDPINCSLSIRSVEVSLIPGMNQSVLSWLSLL
jgi:hypothetical protein